MSIQNTFPSLYRSICALGIYVASTSCSPQQVFDEWKADQEKRKIINEILISPMYADTDNDGRISKYEALQAVELIQGKQAATTLLARTQHRFFDHVPLELDFNPNTSTLESLLTARARLQALKKQDTFF